jgi:transcriptional regulator with XRE-family HTH domain
VWQQYFRIFSKACQGFSLKNYKKGDEKVLERIKALCVERGISIAELERATGIGNGTIARWGQSSPRVDKLLAVADYFGCPVGYLLGEN